METQTSVDMKSTEKRFRLLHQQIWYAVGIFGWIFLLLFACTERPRNNPFEPDTENPPLTLSLQPHPDRVLLTWRFNVDIDGFTGFRVYRGADTADNMVPLAELSADQVEYTDTSVQKGRWYFYQVSVLGRSVESRPSRVRKTILGDGFYWVLSRSSANIQQLSYDLIHPLRDFQTFYLTDVWATPRGDSLFWLGTPTFVSSVVALNRETGRETFYEIDSLRTAQDLQFDPLRNQLYILDNAAKKFFVTRQGNPIGQRTLPAGQTYRKMVADPAAPRLWLLSESAVSVVGVNPPFALQQIFPLPAGFTGRDIVTAGDKILVLAADENARTSRLFTFSPDLTLENTLSLSGNFLLVRFHPADQTLILAENLGSETEQIVKMDRQGNRLFSLPGFRLITDIAINPFDGTFAVADFLDHLVRSYTPTGQPISESRSEDGNKFIFQPVRLFVE